MSRSTRDAVGTRAFRALLALYPAAFRDDYGRELTLVFVDRYRDAASPWSRLRLWIEALAGILADAPREHRRMILQDLRDASRVLRQHALVTLTIVVTLGLGIGANTAVFSVLNAVTLRGLPLRDADRLFIVNGGSRVATGPESARLSGPMFERLREAAPAGVGVAAMSRGVARVYTRTADAAETTPASLQLVSASFFRVLGATPALGRMPEDDERAHEDEAVAVISHDYWQRRFGGAADILGRALTINGSTFTIAGVGPRGFAGVWLELPVDIWVPLAMQGAVKYSQDFSADGVDPRRSWLAQPNIWWLHVIVRTPPDREAAAIGAFNAALSDLAKRDMRIVLQPLGRGFSNLRQQFSTPLIALTAMAALVLLIACANVANLLLARALGRQREMAVRVALGAGRLRLFHQLLTESLLLVMLAGAAAILFARWAGDLLVRTATATSDGVPPFAASVDWRVLAFTAGAACVSVLLFGVLPAWRATRLDVAGALKASARGTMGGGIRAARLLVTVQVALSFVLVVGMGLFVRSFHNLLDVDLGFDRERLVSIAIDPRISGPTREDLATMHQRVLDAVSAVPGVRSASLAMCGLHTRCRAREDGIRIEGYRASPDEQVIFVVNSVSPSYFSTVGMRLLAGRALSDRDLPASPKVAVVNHTLATTYFPNGQAIGKRFGEDAPDVEIVGIVEDARLLSVKEAAVPTVYFPLAQRVVAARSLDVRTSVDPQQTIAALRRAVAAAAPGLPIEGIVTMEERVRRGLSQERLVMLLTSGFGALALGLAGFGLFGVVSYAVVRRTPEFGLRMALGAPRSRILRSVVRDALGLVLCGAIVGVPFVYVGGRFASTLVFGISPYDRVSLIAAALVLLAVGTVCSLIPALRASRVDPMVALRQE